MKKSRFFRRNRRLKEKKRRIRVSFFPKRDVVKKSFFDKGDFFVTIPACLSDHATKNRMEKNLPTGLWWKLTVPPKAPAASCYLLRTNIRDWSAEDLWHAYIQLTEAEAAFRIEKSDLRIRPIWHQKEERVLAHILVCFLVYVLWKTLGQMVKSAGLGDEPHRVLEELGKIRLIDVVLPTSSGEEIRKRCIT